MIATSLLDSLRAEARLLLGRELAEAALLTPNEDEEQKAWGLLLGLVKSENRKGVLAQQVSALAPDEREEVAKCLFDEFFRLGPLQSHIENIQIEEIMVNRHDLGFLIYSGGNKEQFDPGFNSEEEVRTLLSRAIARTGRRIDDGAPAVDVRLSDGSRMHAVLPPVVESPCITIRRHRLVADSLGELVGLGTLTAEAATYLAQAVENGINILVSGATGTGKSTTLNALGRAIPADERVITIEETAELRLRHFLSDCVGMEQRKPNAEGIGDIPIQELVRQALRMRPNRIIVGEVRGPEALDMLSAMNTGHEGSMGTIHASSARQALSKLQMYALRGGESITSELVSRLIAETIELIVHLRFDREGTRRVAQIAEVAGIEGDQVLTNDIFRLQDEQLVRSAIRPRLSERLPETADLVATNGNGETAWRR